MAIMQKLHPTRRAAVRLLHDRSMDLRNLNAENQHQAMMSGSKRPGRCLEMASARTFCSVEREERSTTVSKLEASMSAVGVSIDTDLAPVAGVMGRISDDLAAHATEVDCMEPPPGAFGGATATALNYLLRRQAIARCLRQAGGLAGGVGSVAGGTVNGMASVDQDWATRINGS